MAISLFGNDSVKLNYLEYSIGIIHLFDEFTICKSMTAYIYNMYRYGLIPADVETLRQTFWGKIVCYVVGWLRGGVLVAPKICGPKLRASESN